MRKLLLSLFLATISSSAYSAAAFPVGEGDESSCSASSLVRGSLEFIESQADNGDPDAQIKVAAMYLEGAEGKKDFNKSIAHAKDAAEKGDESAEYIVLIAAHNLYLESGDKENLDLFYHYAKILEEKTNPRALLSLSVLYRTASIFDKDEKRADELLEKAKTYAVINGMDVSHLESSIYGLAGKYKKLETVDESNPSYTTEVVRFVIESAEHGSDEAQYAMGKIYITGGPDIEVDHVKAREYFEKAVEKGHNEAKVALALMCNAGEGGEKDLPKARRLLEESAEKSSNLMTRFMLAMMRNIGEGGEKSPEKARLLLESYVDAGHKKSLAYLAFMYFEGIGGDKNYDLARKYLEEAIDELEPYQHGLLAIMYFNGWGGDKKMEKVRHHLKIAADETGLPEMEHDLGSRYYRGEGGAVDHAKAFEYFSRAAEKEWGLSFLMLGIMHLQGQTAHGVNIPLGMTYIERAAVKGVPMAGIILQQLRLDMRN